MDEELKQEADRRFEAALEERGARDPRDYYRDRLRELKEEDPDAYHDAVRHYAEELIPAVASGEAEPLEAWRQYGLLIARLTADGRPVEIDRTGRSHAYDDPPAPEHMVLHMPDSSKRRALLVSLPPAPSPAQRAAYDLLVRGKQKLPG